MTSHSWTRLFRIAAVSIAILALATASTEPIPSPAPRLTIFDSAIIIRKALRGYRWPTDAGCIVTSTFGEYRASHFHAGVDISTGDDTGFHVFAPRDGWVSRVVVTATGYGKYIVLRHPDGFSTAFAHLSAFAPLIQDRVRHEQERRGSYPVEITFQPGSITVAQGDVIALTGDTGIGTPHLHFEVYDPSGAPVNPLDAPGFSPDDDIPPTITRVAVSPLDETSLVNGSLMPQVFPVRSIGRNRFVVPEKIRISGAVGFAVEARDRAPDSRFRRGVYTHRLSIDGHESYAVSMDRLPDPSPYQIGLHVDWDLLQHHHGRFERLYSLAGPLFPLGQPSSVGAGIVRPASIGTGPHRFSIVSEDINANAAEVTGEIIVDTGNNADTLPSPPVLSSAPVSGRLTLGQQCDGTFVTVTVLAPAPFATQPVIQVYEGDWNRSIVIASITGKMASSRFRPLRSHSGTRRVVATTVLGAESLQGNLEFDLFPIEPDRPGALTFFGGDLRLAWDSAAVYRPVFLTVSRAPGVEGVEYSIEPHAEVLRGGIRVEVHDSSASSNAGMFYRGTGGLSLIGRRSGAVWSGRLSRRLGTLTLRTDSTPPSITDVHVDMAARPSILFRFRDDLSGVDYSQLKLYIDSLVVIPEVDGEHRRAVYHARDPLAHGTHEVTIRLTDRLGNASTVRRKIIVR